MLNNNLSFAEAINAGANYWKHHEEWFEIDFASSKHREDTFRTLDKLVLANAPRADYTCSNLLAVLVGAEEFALSSLLPKLSEWYENVNCLSELVEETGGSIDLDKLPVGDPTLSAKEIIGNESQERMGLVIGEKDIDKLKRIAKRERSPFYEVGEVTNDHKFKFESKKTGEKPMDFDLEDMFGSSPKTIMNDVTIERVYDSLVYSPSNIKEYLLNTLSLEAVASKDWLTNKVDRCVTGKVAKQQCVGPLQIPLNNCGVMALDYQGKEGVATSIGHSPISALIDPVAGSRNSIAEALTNIIWAPLEEGLKSVSLSANWMWPCNNEGEDARLYKAVEGISEFAISLGINVPTGKDSLSMKQKYKNEEAGENPGKSGKKAKK